MDKHGKRKPESEMTELEKLRAENRILEARNKRLETENAVLKKLREYQLKDEAKLKEQQQSFKS